jgi:hypothetical protein
VRGEGPIACGCGTHVERTQTHVPSPPAIVRSAKLTKLPGDKASRKLVTAELKEVVQAQRSAGVAKKTKGKLKFRGDAKPGEATMEE